VRLSELRTAHGWKIVERSGMQVDLNYPGACWMDKRLVRVVAEEEVPGAVYL
jgi:hypothetical protein